MAKYEMMLIVDTTISEEDRDNSINELKELFKTNSVEITNEDVWGNKKMAYKINKSDRWYYILFDLEMDGKLIKELSKTINLDKNILRYMFVKKES